MPHSIPVSKLIINRNQWPQFRASTPIKDAIRILRILSEDEKLAHGHDTPLVLDDEYRLLGYVTLIDLLRNIRHLVEDPGRACELGKAVSPVSEIVREFAAELKPDDSILSALDIMASKGVSLLPVLENGKLKGLIKLSDIFNKVAHLLFDEEVEDEHWFSGYMHTEP
jgi:CBS domain-containing protein